MFFINDIRRYIIATSCDLKNERNKSSLVFFLFFHCLRYAVDLKTEDCFK